MTKRGDTQMLHCLTAEVIHGRGIGARAGFPTANLGYSAAEPLPPFGVYATMARYGNTAHFGVTNVGTRPTADDRRDVTVETWLPGEQIDLYGARMTLEFLRYLRPTRRFEDMKALKAQIDRDAAEAKEWVSAYPEGQGFVTFSAAETRALGARLAAGLQKGSVIVLRGGMGAGKSEFSRGIARGLGVTGPVPSPSFTILNAYDQGRIPLYHFDWYRVEDPEELREIGAYDLLPGDGATVVEWAERAEDWLPARRTEVFLQPLSDNARLIFLAPLGGQEKPVLEDRESC